MIRVQTDSSVKGLTDTAMDQQRFRRWLVLVGIVFAASGACIIYLNELLIEKNAQNEWTDYLVSALFLYGYTRMLMHHVTCHLFQKCSPTLRLLSQPVQNDCVYMIIDALSGWMWIPVVIYSAVKVFILVDPERFTDEMYDFGVVIMAIYELDRLIQLTVHFRIDRCVHHLLTVFWMLVVTEWSPTEILDPTVVVGGCMMEAFSKIMWWIHLSDRFARKFARSRNGNWDAKSLNTVDALLICQSVEKQQQFSRRALVCFILNIFVIPVSLTLAYLVVAWEYQSVFWKIFPLSMLLVFNLLDFSAWKVMIKQAKFTYWSRDVLNQQRRKEIDPNICSDADETGEDEGIAPGGI